jgi:V8-like Glu-specific endopeptidase
MLASGLLITNNHVIESAEDGSRSRVRFNYQADASGRLAQSEYFACRPEAFFYTNRYLDYTLIAVDGSPGTRYGIVPLGTSQTPILGDRVCIIQHPMGEPKQIALVDNEIEYVDDQIVQYLTDTLPGSSGSPVFNESWELVALHHSGGWLPEPASTSTHFRNEGIMMSAIVADLVAAGMAT